MEESPRISSSPPSLQSQDFEFLRSEALAVIQSIAHKTWTDHNLHDPGITLLEALCYAVTETGLRAGMDVKDLIATASADRLPEYFSAGQLLPSAPVKLNDFRKILISHPLVNNAWVFPLESLPKGQLSTLLEFSEDELNSNIFSETVSPGSLTKDYEVEIAFPHWNDEEITPMHEIVTLNSVNFDGAPSDVWHKISGGSSYYSRVVINYQPSVGPPADMELWVVVNIVTEIEDAGVEIDPVLSEVEGVISALGSGTVLDLLNIRVSDAYETMRIVRRYMQPYRNLCESITEFSAVKLQEVSVAGIIEVASGVNVEGLLAEMYYRIYRMISPFIQLTDLDEQMDLKQSADLVFDGPLINSGFLSEASLGRQEIVQHIYTSDIVRIIYQLRNEEGGDVEERESIEGRSIIAVRALELSNYLDNRPITVGSKDCLQLVSSKNHIPRLSATKSRIAVFRNGIQVDYDADLVIELFQEKLKADVQESISSASDISFPLGDQFDLTDYYPIQNDLPRVYGVGESGLPEAASEERKAQAKQLKGYMFFYEQLLAGSQSQLLSFNSIFSADPAINKTLFQRPLYSLPDIAPLFTGVIGNVTWSDFQNDTDNSYINVLNDRIETEEQFLRRRNVMLDHLLANLGEDMSERAALLFRLASEVPSHVALSLTQLLNYQKSQRQQAMKDLIKDKSAFFYDLPMLNRDKGQAYGHPLWRHFDFLQITKAGNTFNWTISDSDGTPVFRNIQSEPASSLAEVTLLAFQVMQLATNIDKYSVRIEPGGERRLEISASASADPLAESVEDYATDPLADAGISDTAETMLSIWQAYALIPLELRLYHLLGVDRKTRTSFTFNINDFVEIFDEVDADPIIEKRFTLWSEAGFAGDDLLTSSGNYPGATDPEAMDNVRGAVQQMIDYGVFQHNYHVEEVGPGSLRVFLRLPDGSDLAQSPATFTDYDLATQHITQTQRHIYSALRSEGFYLLENQLLFPTDTASPALEINEYEDPYSYQLTIVIPSGYARDFSGGDPQQHQPSLYRNLEFRKYAEEQIRQHCPAHILCRVIWADRVIPGNPVVSTDPSFEAFEQAYMDWLALYLTNDVEETVLGPARDDLTTVVNTLYLEYYSE